MQKLTISLKQLALSLILLLGLIMPVVAAVPASAQGSVFQDSRKEACAGAQLTKDSGPNCGKDDQQTLSNIIRRVIDVLSVIIGIAAVIMIIISGLRYITAGGDSNGITSAKNTFIYALVGLVIVAFAQVIVKFVLRRVQDGG